MDPYFKALKEKVDESDSSELVKMLKLYYEVMKPMGNADKSLLHQAISNKSIVEKIFPLVALGFKYGSYVAAGYVVLDTINILS